MGIDFFKDGNELKQKSKEELIRDIENMKKENQKIVKELKSREDLYLKENLKDLDVFLVQELSFVLTADEKDKKIYKFVKNEQEYSMEVSSLFITYSKPKSRTSYRYDMRYENDNLYFESLDESEYISSYSSYTYSKDLSQLLKEYKECKEVLEENKKAYMDIEDLEAEELYLFKVCEQNSYKDEDKKIYYNLVDFIKEIL